MNNSHVLFIILDFESKGYDAPYDPELDPSLPVSFFAAAFRFGHSLIPSVIERWSLSHKLIGNYHLI